MLTRKVCDELSTGGGQSRLHQDILVADTMSRVDDASHPGLRSLDQLAHRADRYGQALVLQHQLQDQAPHEARDHEGRPRLDVLGADHVADDLRQELLVARVAQGAVREEGDAGVLQSCPLRCAQQVLPPWGVVEAGHGGEERRHVGGAEESQEWCPEYDTLGRC